MIELERHPRVIGQHLGGKPLLDLPEDLELPFPDSPLASCTFPFKSVLEVMEIMAQRKADFEANQFKTLLNPPRWENVGYVEEEEVITAYYQIGYPVRAIEAA